MYKSSHLWTQDCQMLQDLQSLDGFQILQVFPIIYPTCLNCVSESVLISE